MLISFNSTEKKGTMEENIKLKIHIKWHKHNNKAML